MNETEYEMIKYKLALAMVSHARGKDDEGLREIEKAIPLIDKLIDEIEGSPDNL